MAINRRKALLASSIAVPAGFMSVSGLAAPAVRTKDSVRLRMVTSWGKSAPGPGTTADRIAARIEALSAGRIKIDLFGAGELVPAFGVFNAVSQGIADIGHSASFFQAGEHPAATIFTTLPFGMGPKAHNAWIAQGGGQQYWDKIYADFNVKPYLAGNSDATMGGWHKKSLVTLEDLKGRRLRVAGLGAKIYAALGATVITLAPSEIFMAFSGASLDGVEFLGPFSDQAAGFSQVARYYYWPGFNKPNGSAEGLLNRTTFDKMSSDHQAIVQTAFELENHIGLAESTWYNAKALHQLRNQGVTVAHFPADIIDAAKRAWREIKADWRAQNPEVEPTLGSYETAASFLGDWTALQA